MLLILELPRYNLMPSKKARANKTKMSDIARLAGVSESTVSRALSNSPLINLKTRERIQQLAREHHYAINRQAQNLRLQTSKTILVVIPVDHSPRQQISDPFFMELLGAIADGLMDAGFELLLSRVHKDDWQSCVASHNYATGLIIIGQSLIHDSINEFAVHNPLPCVVWGGQLPNQQYISVGCDNRAGGYLATEHLFTQGRQTIVFLGNPDIPEVGLRYEGYLEAHASAGKTADSARLVPCEFDRQNANQAVIDLINSDIDFDAIFAASDVIAQEATRQLEAHGLLVPKQVAVMGFDDVMLSRHMSPALTTVSQSIYDTGQHLVANLLRQMQGQRVHSESHPPQLVIRAST